MLDERRRVRQLKQGPNTSMTSDMAGAVKGSPGFLNGFDPCKGPGLSVFP
jgi:hypothetical protein